MLFSSFPGDLVDEEEVLEWLTDPDNLELADHIESVNAKMFQRVLQRSDYLALVLCKWMFVFFLQENGRRYMNLSRCTSDSDTGCKQCAKVLQILENIDDEADAAGIDFVKVDDANLSKSFGAFTLPSLLFFKNHDKEPVIYTG